MKISIRIGKPKVHISVKAPVVGVSTGIPVARDYVERPAYEGEYDVIPGETEAILNTKNLRMEDNVRVAPIPYNYARMLWNGTTLTFY